MNSPGPVRVGLFDLVALATEELSTPGSFGVGMIVMRLTKNQLYGTSLRVARDGMDLGASTLVKLSDVFCGKVALDDSDRSVGYDGGTGMDSGRTHAQWGW